MSDAISDSWDEPQRHSQRPIYISSDEEQEGQEMDEDSQSDAEHGPSPPLRRRGSIPRSRRQDDSSDSRDASPPPKSTSKSRVVPSKSKSGTPKGKGKRATGAKSSQWMYTLHHPSADDFQKLQALHLLSTSNVTYHAFQCEFTPSDGHPHLQGYICFRSGRQMSTVKALIREDVHLEPTKGTPDEASEYCTRPDKRHSNYLDFVFEFGELPAALAGKGKRSDLHSVKVLLDQGTHPNQVMQLTEHFVSSAKHWKFFQHYYNAIAPDRTAPPYVFVMYGDPGTGKTMAASRFAASYHAPTGSSGTQWYDGYDPRKHISIVFNEFSGNRMALGELLRLMDKDPMQVNRKGAYVTFNPKGLVFTSNDEPQNWYGWNDPERSKNLSSPYAALERRLSSVWHYQDMTSASHLLKDAEEACKPNTAKAVCFCLKGNPDFHPYVQSGLYKKIVANIFAIPNLGDELAETLPAEDLDLFAPI